MRTPLLTVLFVASLLLVACGSDDASDSTSDVPAEAVEAPAETVDAAAESVDAASETAPTPDAGGEASATASVAATDLGDVLVGSNGFTLYGFTTDSDGTPTCIEGCAEAWPPVRVDSPDVPEGLDPAVFSVVERPDGGYQLKAGEWPLYFFAGDLFAGDVNGQASGDVWFVAAPDGSLIGAGEPDDDSADLGF